MVSASPFNARWGRDIQPCKAARLLSGGVLPVAVFGKLLQFAIPASGSFIIHDQRTEHAHALHQRGCRTLPPAAARVVFSISALKCPMPKVKFYALRTSGYQNPGMVKTAAGASIPEAWA